MEPTRLPCPLCGNPSVVGEASCMVEVGTGVAGIVYGNPVVLILPDHAAVQCNSNGCGWSGTAAEVRKAAEA